MIRTDKRLRLCTALLVCNLVFIWGNSLLPADVSQSLSDLVKGFLEAIFRQSPTGDTGSGIVRKAAHFLEFTGLGMLLAWRAGMLGKGKLPAFCWGAAAACVDETIQMFVPDRGPGIRDVLIDSSGVAAGILLLRLGHALRKKDLPKTIRRNNVL